MKLVKETKRYTQVGTFSVVILLLPALYFSAVAIWTALSSGTVKSIHLLLIAIFAVCLLIFYRLTITLDGDHVSFKMGIGLFGRSYKLSDIKSCKAVKNSPLYGIGIRFILNGWLYNVSGLSAIELHFKNRKSIVRIGTDKAEEISARIEAMLSDYTARDNGKEILGIKA